MNTSELTRTDRDQLLRLNRARVKLAIDLAAQRKAELKAAFESKLAAEYKPDDNDAWKKAEAKARQAIEEANRIILREAQNLGIPRRFAPGVNFYWRNRGENGWAERRGELRKVAYTRLDEMERAAKAEVKRKGLMVETEILSGSLSDAGKSFLNEMPTVEDLMPQLELPAVEALLPGPRYPWLKDDDREWNELLMI